MKTEVLKEEPPAIHTHKQVTTIKQASGKTHKNKRIIIHNHKSITTIKTSLDVHLELKTSDKALDLLIRCLRFKQSEMVTEIPQ